MEDSRSIETEVGVDLYEEVVGDLDYSIPITSRSASPNRCEEDRSTLATFQGPITHSSESKVTSASAGLVASVPWPALRCSCSIVGNNSRATVAFALGRKFRDRPNRRMKLFISYKARLSFSLRQTSRECVHLVTRGHILSRDKDGGHSIRSAVSKNPMHHAKFMTLCFIESGIGILGLCCFCDLNLNPMTFISPGDISDERIRASCVRVFESYRLKDIQTGRKKSK